MTIDGVRFGPWAVVTGASSGIGDEFTRQLAAAGINVVMVARRKWALDAIGAELAGRHGVDYRTVGIDLTEPGFMTQIVEATRDLHIGLLVSNAGAGKPGRFLSESLDAHRAVMRLNTVAHCELAHHFGERMAQRGHGGIVLVSALGAAHGIPYMANAAATKAYVTSLGEGLHVEMKKHGVHVTVLHPGPTRTPVLEEFGLVDSRLPVPTMSVQQTVAETLNALARNRARCIPGLMNRIMVSVTPGALIRPLMAGMLAGPVRAAERAR